ncbi:hypothetical protein F5Y16DRAFT_115915 [Xylariaceae sp. FL0255]|nr:hypothetical protein F5Y16DRAFT_115915 [Xylariaceae sp. FL0255]
MLYCWNGDVIWERTLPWFAVWFQTPSESLQVVQVVQVVHFDNIFTLVEMEIDHCFSMVHLVFYDWISLACPTPVPTDRGHWWNSNSRCASCPAPCILDGFVSNWTLADDFVINRILQTQDVPWWTEQTPFIGVV